MARSRLLLMGEGTQVSAPAACAGTLALLAALTSHQPGHLGRAAIGAGARTEAGRT